MTERSRAIFLSYASQDAGPARRICDALHAAGVEVFLDQSELRGGDTWDQKIRHEIQDCALFIPIISQHTQERLEGYFRLEWKLAVDRTHLMADRKAFLLPVVIDGTKDKNAEVPAAFRAVQWTRLPGGETPPEFVERIKGLLSRTGIRVEATQPNIAPATVSPRAPFTPSAPSETATTPRKFSTLSTALAFVAVFAIGYICWQQIRGRSPAASTMASAPAVSEQSVAVLPFVNESPDKEQDYFADGLTETMIGLLSKVPDLRVPARSASFYFKDKNEELIAIADKLHVVHLLEGTVRKAGNRLRISAELIRADTGFHVWSETYDREVSDVFKVQDDISAAIVAALKLKFAAAGTNTKVRGTSNVEAYNQYLLGVHYHATEVGGLELFRREVVAFSNAVALDPAYAEAAAKLVLTQTYLADFAGDAVGLKRAIAAAERLPLDHPDYGPSYRIRAGIRVAWLWDWVGAQADYQKALALDPNDADAHYDIALLLHSLGRYPDAIAATHRALALDGSNLSYLNELAAIQMSMRDFATAEQSLRRMQEIEPHSELAASISSSLRLLQGRFADSLAQCPGIQDARARLVCMAEAQHSLGHRAEADQAFAELLKTGTGGNFTNLAVVATWFGNIDQAFAWFDKAAAARENGMSQITADRSLDVLCKDPRWNMLLKRLNLPT